MNGPPKIFGKPQDQFVADVGYALGQVKFQRGLSPEDMRIVFGLKDPDMVSKYIAGEHEMKMTTWLRAIEAWPEIIDILHETEADRVLKGRQRALELDRPQQRRADA